PIDAHYALEMTLAEAAGAGPLVRFLEALGRYILQRQSVRVESGRLSGQRSYLEKTQGEHRAIVAAIRGRDPAAAREAMRRHLTNGRERYRKLATVEAGA